LADSRSIRFGARKAVRPVGKWPDTTKMIAELRKARAWTLAFAAVTETDLRGHFFPHIAFGDLDCYQWLVVLGQLEAATRCKLSKSRPARYILLPSDAD
jgi:hypothetical protein